MKKLSRSTVLFGRFYESGEAIMLNINVAQKEDYIKVRDFYYHLIDEMRNAEYKPGWEKDIYPTQEFLISSINNHELYVTEQDDSIIGCMVVNHEYNDEYKNIKWSIGAQDSELLVIHALGVHPRCSGHGIAKQMVQKVIDIAKNTGIKTIRLDVLSGNIPAEKAYTKMGFIYKDTVEMFYEDTGRTAYKVFEYIV